VKIIGTKKASDDSGDAPFVQNENYFAECVLGRLYDADLTTRFKWRILDGFRRSRDYGFMRIFVLTSFIERRDGEVVLACF